MFAAPGSFTVNYQTETATSLFSPISCPIRAASEVLICGHENTVNGIIAALSCALMLGEKARGGPSEEGGGVGGL